MNRKYCLDKKEWEEAQAALLHCKNSSGSLKNAGIEALEKKAGEEKIKEKFSLWCPFLFSSHVSSVRTHTI